jgi:glycosyltransferase involved in cell wall biosynthesis
LILHRQANIGLAATLNRGIAMTTSPFIARMDQDDIALPERFARQLKTLIARPNIAVLGTWAQILSGSRPTGRFHRHPTTQTALSTELLFDNPFVHSSIMMRTAVVRAVGGYNVHQERGFPEDYDLWSRVAVGYELGNLPEILTLYREVPGSISRISSAAIMANVIEISSRNLDRALGPSRSDEARILSLLYHGQRVHWLAGLRAIKIWQILAQDLGGTEYRLQGEFRSSSRRISRRLLSMLARQQPGLKQLAVGIRRLRMTLRG